MSTPSTPSKPASRRTLAIDDYQREHRVLGFPIAVIYKFFDDSGAYLAALMTYYAFVSLFPLLLLLSTVLSILLRNNPDLQRHIVESAASQFPVVGQQLKNPKSLSGGVSGVLAGVAFATYGGLGVGQAVQYAMNTAWAVPRNSRPNPIFARFRSLLLVGCAALVLLTTTVVSALGGFLPGDTAQVMAWFIPVVIVVVNALIFIGIYRHGSSRKLSPLQVLPGSILAALAWALLQTYGFKYVAHVIRRAGATDASGTNLIFATVLGLLAFIYLASIITVFCVEVNVVLDKKLYPRALLTPFTDNVVLTSGDRRTYTAIAQANRHKGFERIDVSFDERPPAERERDRSDDN